MSIKFVKYSFRIFSSFCSLICCFYRVFYNDLITIAESSSSSSFLFDALFIFLGFGVCNWSIGIWN